MKLYTAIKHFGLEEQLARINKRDMRMYQSKTFQHAAILSGIAIAVIVGLSLIV